jgi:hypothetical protein
MTQTTARDALLPKSKPRSMASSQGSIGTRVHRHKVPEGECAYCDRERAAGNNYHPAHDASERCESGKRPHCSCDTCF